MDYVCSLFYGWLANSGAAVFFRNSHWPITGLQKQRKQPYDKKKNFSIDSERSVFK